MEKQIHHKGKNKKPPTKSKTSKKTKNEGPTCSMFLAEITRKLAAKKKQDEESPTTIVETIIDSITNALPFKLSRRSPIKKDSPMKIETLQTFAPELIPKDTLTIVSPVVNNEDAGIEEVESAHTNKPGFKMPKMPLVSSDVIKLAVDKRKKAITRDASMNTSIDHDVASELSKHVNTLRKISLIAEEFNQKTAKNLKEIVDSVQEDLIKKLEEVRADQRTSTSKNEHNNLKEDNAK